ncbi:hypothetical protein [Pyxidicoccus xibeiensis]|uniref:hypothetical protein n=1 Tax=Pyxidicoccus xibeiensis TaxID=2906759 RepID=UPI0020A713B8|nr:hypothetical protein [Pyxidicoccus xibeiensis]MCP3137765.1 hypothetical protein [Pyxidicoccus xibeiensis]
MSNQRIDGFGGGAVVADAARKAAEEAARRAAEEAARRAAEEAARRAAEEAARKATEEASRKAAEALRQIARSSRFTTSGFDAGASKQPMQLDGGTTAPASTLLTENARDGKANCLDVAADWLAKASPELRARSELVFLKDTRGGVEGQSGHVVIRQGNSIYDPSTGKSYADMEAFRKAQPQYKEVGSLRGPQAARIFAAPPGSAERARAIAQAKVPDALQHMLVADPPAPGLAAAPRELNAGSKAHAEADYQRLASMSPLAHGPEVARMLEEHKHDPDYQAHLISLMAQGGRDSVLFNVGASLFFGGAQGLSAEQLGQRQTFIDALKAARDAGTFTAADLQRYAGWGPSPWGEVKRAMNASPVAPPLGADAAVRELNAASGVYESAKASAAGRDEELAKQLAAFGPALTNEQRSAYIQAFQQHPDNKRIYDALTAATENLANVVERNEAALRTAAISRPATDGQALNTALIQLADSPRARVALEVAGRLVTPADSVLARTFMGFPDFETKAIQEAIPNAAVDILSQLDNPQDGLQQLEGLLTPFKLAFADTTGAGGDILEGMVELRKMAGGDLGALEDLAGKWESCSGWVKALGIAGVAFGGMAAVNAGREGDYGTVLKEIAASSKGGLSMLAETTEALADAGKFALFGVDHGATARSFASFATRLAPVLGLVASATSLGLRLQDLQDEPNVGKLIALVGDAVGVLGAAVELIPGGQPVGVLVSGIAAAITFLGESISWGLEQGEFEAQRREFLEKAGVRDPLLQILLGADPTLVRNLATKLKIAPADVQRLALQYPWLLESGRGTSLDSFVKLAQAFGLEGEAAFQALSTMASSSAYPPDSTLAVLGNLAATGGLAQDQGQWLAVLNGMRQQLGPEHQSTIDALERALREAAAKAP